MQDERSDWNRRYRERSHSSLEPDPLLPHAYKEFIQPLFPDAGTALDLAGGLGRHALWLARKGWHVTSIDISDEATAQAEALAEAFGERIKFQTADLTSWRADQPVDLVLVFFYLERQLFPEMLKALRPGGLLIYKTYTHLSPKFGKGPTHPMHLLQDGELLQAFPQLRVLHYEEAIRDRGVAELIAQKPKKE